MVEIFMHYWFHTNENLSSQLVNIGHPQLQYDDQ